MRIVRFIYKRRERWGILKQDVIEVLKGDPFSRVKASGNKVLLRKVKLLAPVVPGKVILVGLNYRRHAQELKMKIPQEPIIFLKPPSSVIGPEEKIVYPKGVKRLDYEAELAVVIKKKAKNIPQKEVYRYILGYTCLNDVTARCLQEKDGQWTRAKSFDTFCPLGPWIETRINPRHLRIRSYLNQRLKQCSNTSDFIFKLPFIVSFVSKVMTLLPGDIISTGTPQGVGRMRSSDTIEIDIEGIGRLKNSLIPDRN